MIRSTGGKGVIDQGGPTGFTLNHPETEELLQWLSSHPFRYLWSSFLCEFCGACWPALNSNHTVEGALQGHAVFLKQRELSALSGHPHLSP